LWELPWRDIVQTEDDSGTDASTDDDYDTYVYVLLISELASSPQPQPARQP